MTDGNSRDARQPMPPDDFWALEDLLPKKSQQRTPSVAHFQTDTVEIELPTVPTAVDDAPQTGRDMPLPATPRSTPTPVRQPYATYQPRHPLIREVRLYEWQSAFRYYERFCSIATQLFLREGSPCPRVPFFSYMPQHEQMNQAQLDFYLYLRSCIRRGEYPETDDSYLFLFLFEVINLPDKIPPQQGQRYLCEIWRHYRVSNPLLKRYLADWICDYSLIHQLPPPQDADCLADWIECSNLKEFYAYPSGADETSDAAVYLAFCCNYDFHKSRTYRANAVNAELFDTHIPRAITAVLRALEQAQTPFSATDMQKTTVNRDAFVGALCSYRIKRRLEVEYCSFTRSHSLRYLMSDIVKYTENRLRGVLGVKSRLTVFALPDVVRTVLDEYLNANVPRGRALQEQRERIERPAYESLYDVAQGELSSSHAVEIEMASWQTTHRLVEAFEEPSDQTPQTGEDTHAIVPSPRVEVVPFTVAEPSKEEDGDPWQEHRAFLAAVLQQDKQAQLQLSRQKGIMIDALVEQINALAFDVWGDILLEENDGAYTVIEEYRTQLEQFLMEGRK